MNEVQAELLQRAILNIEKLKERIEALEQRFQPGIASAPLELSPAVHIGSRVYLKKLLSEDHTPIGTWGAILFIGPNDIGVIFEKRKLLTWLSPEEISEYLEFAFETYEDLNGYAYENAEKVKKDAEQGLFKCLERRGIINL